ncbi:MAG: MG2 domain-containing protein [Candidatus Sumerlaeaceae bacterium]|nr:MG2 domain-containing protein [Candidatus Sumerlaeaceae bacterium]
MRRTAVLLSLVVLAAAAILTASEQIPTLQSANKLFAEQSWQMALEQYQQIRADESATTATRREALLRAGWCMLELHRHEEAEPIFEQVLKDGDSDAWAGRAYWQLVRLRANYLPDGDARTTMIEYLRRADRLLTEAPAAERRQFYREVAYDIAGRVHFDNEQDRAFVFGFYDKLIPLLENEQQIAEAHLRRADASGYVTGSRDTGAWIAALRQIAKEFPRTPSAPNALMQVALHYMSQNDLPAAAAEYDRIAREWPTTRPAREAARMAAQIREQQVFFSIESAYRPGETVDIVLVARNVPEAVITVTPFDPVQMLASDRAPKLNLKRVRGEPAKTETVKFQTNDRHEPTTAALALRMEKPGAYVVQARAGSANAYALLLVSNLLLVTNSGSEGVEMWAVEAESGRPKPGISIAFACNPKDPMVNMGGQRQPRFSRVDTLRTDDSGFATADVSPYENRAYMAIARDGDHYAIATGYHFGNAGGRDDEYRVYIYSDRPVYRPEQEVHYRAIVRGRKGGDYVGGAGARLRVTIEDPQGQTVHESGEVTANEFGSVSGSMKLGSAPPLGRYRIRVTDASSGRGMSEEAFRVEEYKKPEYEVTVKATDKLFRIGSKVRATVEAKYYFGAPVADGEVQYTVRRRERWFPLPRPMGHKAADLAWFDLTPPDPGLRHGSVGDIVASGQGRTDAQGRFELEFDAEVPPEQPGHPYPPHRRGWWWWPPEGRAFDFQIEVTVTDKSRRNIDGSQTIVVSDRALQLRVSPQQNLYSAGDLVKADLTASNMSGDPVATSATLYVEKVEWNPDLGEEKVTTVSSERVDIGASGTLTATWRVPEGVTGRMRLLLAADDPFGARSHARAWFTVADEKTRDIFIKYQGVEIIADKEIHEVGETARVLITCEFPGASAWYWIDSGTGNLDKRVLPLEHRTTFVKIPVTDAFVPNSKIHVVVVRDGQVFMDEHELIVPPTRKVLTVEVRPDRETYRPGEKGAVTVTARDFAGKPVKAEFSLAMFDQSILYIASDTRTDIRRFFYGERRALVSNVGNSEALPGQYNELDPPIAQNLLFRHGAGSEHRPRRRSGGRGDIVMRDVAAPDMIYANGLVAGAVPMPAAPMAMAASREMGEAAPLAESKAAASQPFHTRDGLATEDAKMAPAVIRSDFRDSMFWSPTILTGEDGRATVEVQFPDSLTTWRAVAVGITPDTLVGNASVETVVKKNLLVRLETPRFFRERDEVTLSANVHNYLGSEKAVTVRLKANGLEFSGEPQKITVPAGGEKRVDWTVKAATWGDATLTVEALTDEESDAAKFERPVLPHGIDKFVAWNGSSDDSSTAGLSIERNGATVRIAQEIEVPRERIIGSTRLTVLLSPSLASAVREALPYMVEYPYGCVEQTMSRFVPAAVVASVFAQLNIPRDEFLEKKVADVTAAGIKRLADMQRPDGGWGWWKTDEPNPYMTAYVMSGLTIAREAGVAGLDDLYNRGLAAVRRSVDEFEPTSDRPSLYWRDNDLHTLAMQLFVLSRASGGDVPGKPLDYLWTRRNDLSPQGLALLARTLWQTGRHDDARVALRNLQNFAVISPENDTARWGRLRGAWYWWDDAVEATAHGLMACLEIDPQNPMARRAMKWLVINRQGARWKSTKDSGLAVLALTAYLKDRRESAASQRIEVTVGGGEPRVIEITPQNFWEFNGRIVLEGDAVPEGCYPVTITRTGDGTLFYSVFAEYFTLEEGIKGAGHEIFVERRYERLVRKTVTDTTAVAAVDTYEPIRDGDSVQSGDEIRVTLRIKSLNDFEYLVFEDPKPAGMEPVALQSGTAYSGGVSNMELRDELVAFFFTHLPQGEREVHYNIRAEIPGTFHTMPTKGYAMYYPPLRANSDELVIKVTDRP